MAWVTPRRWIIFVLALAGVAVAGRLALYQLGLTDAPWEPFFGDGSKAVLHSRFSEALPVPDALLGAIAYAGEALLALLGSRQRERTSPLVTLASGALAGTMALGGAVLVALQAFAIHAFCTLCLTSATISFVIAIVAIDEARHVDVGAILHREETST